MTTASYVCEPCAMGFSCPTHDPGRDKIYIGGLLRCCIVTLREREKPGTEGEIQPCKYCSSTTIFQGDGWRWNRTDLRPGGDA